MAEQSYTFTAVVNWRGDHYDAFCPEVGAASCGDSVEDALYMIKEATELTLQDSPLPGYDKPEIILYHLELAQWNW